MSVVSYKKDKILSNELVAKNQPLSRFNERLNEGLGQRARVSRELSCGSCKLSWYKEREKAGGGDGIRRESWKMANGYDDCYDASWHLFPPDYVEDEYR